MEYHGMIENGAARGEAAFLIGETELEINMTAQRISVPYSELEAFALADHRIALLSGERRLTASRFGTLTEAFFSELWKAYNARVEAAFFVSGEPLIETEGDCSYSDSGGSFSGRAVFRLHERCLCILPAGDKGRRVPLCFVTGIAKNGYKLTITLDTGESYTLAKLGLNTTPFEQKLASAMKALKKEAAGQVSGLYAGDTAAQSEKLAGLMCSGSCAPLGRLAEISQGFVDALGAKLGQSRARDSFTYFYQHSAPRDICVGLKTGFGRDDAAELLWLAAPLTAVGKRLAAVEFAAEGESAATFVYDCREDWELFYRALNHALEAVDFRREVIYLPEEKLADEENALYAMAIARTPQLRMLRARLAARVTHRTPQSWARDMDALLG